MKVEFLDDISIGGKFRQVVPEQLVRLYDFNPPEAANLSLHIAKQILKGHMALNLSSLNFIEPINCNLLFAISDRDVGLETRDKVNFECTLTIQAYQAMLHLIEPFCKGETCGYQWLYELDCPIDLLFSPGGTW